MTISLSKAVLSAPGVLTITGTEFTKTTTTFYVDGQQVAFELATDTEVHVDGAGIVAGAQVTAVKGDVTAGPVSVELQGAEPAPPSGGGDQEAAAPIGDTTPAADGSDPVGEAVEPVKAETIEELGIGQLDPYPTKES